MNRYPFEEPVVWHVVFHPGRLMWSQDFRHVSLAGYVNETWVHLDLHRRTGAMMPIFHYQKVENYLAYLLYHYTVVKFGPARGDQSHFLRPMSCVSFTKHFLGIRSRALLPDGLFNTLIRDYGCKVVPNDPENQRDRRAEAAASEG